MLLTMMGIFTGCISKNKLSSTVQKCRIAHGKCILYAQKGTRSKLGATLIVMSLTITVFSTARLHEIREVRLPHTINTSCGVGIVISKQLLSQNINRLWH